MCDDEKTEELRRKIESLEKELEKCEGDCDESEEEEEEEVVEIEEENNGATGLEATGLEATGLEQIADDLEAEEKNQILEPAPGCDGEPATEADSCDECDHVFLKYATYDPMSGDRTLVDGPGICTGCMLVDDGIRIDRDNIDQLETLGDAEWCEKKAPTGSEEEEDDESVVQQTGPTGNSNSNDDVDVDLEDIEEDTDDDIMKMLDQMTSLIETASRLRGSLKWHE